MSNSIRPRGHEINYTSLSTDQLAHRLEQLRAQITQIASFNTLVQEELGIEIGDLRSRIGQLEHELIDRLIRAEQVALGRLRDESAPPPVTMFRAMPDEITRHHVLPFLDDRDFVSLAEACPTGMSAEARRVVEETWVELDKLKEQYPSLSEAYHLAMTKGAHENPGQRLLRFQNHLRATLNQDLLQYRQPLGPQFFLDLCRIYLDLGRNQLLTRLGRMILKIVGLAVQNEGLLLEYVAPSLRADRDFMLPALQQNGYALRYAADELRADRALVLAAAQQTGYALRFAADELRADRALVLAAVQQNGNALRFAADELRADRALVLVAVQQDGYALQDAADELRADRDLVLAAVQQNGRALQYAADELKADRALVLAAVQQNGYALQYAADELKADRALVLVAVQQNGYALRYAADELRTDRALVLVAVQQGGSALRFAADELRADRALVLVAVQQDGRALQYAADELRADPDLIF